MLSSFQVANIQLSGLITDSKLIKEVKFTRGAH